MTPLARRVDRLEGAATTSSGLDDLTCEELSILLRNLLRATVERDDIDEEDRERARIDLEEIENEAATWAAFWSRPDIADGVEANKVAGRLPMDWTPPLFGNGCFGEPPARPLDEILDAVTADRQVP